MSKPYTQPGEKGTDTNQASELFELCKQVYEKTRWGAVKKTGGSYYNEILDTPQAFFVFPDGSNAEFPYRVEGRSNSYQTEYPNATYVPLYTSDYLLEKLLPITSIQLKRKASGDIRLFYFPEKPDYATYDYDTPLKCLLALTIALSEAGELK